MAGYKKKTQSAKFHFPKPLLFKTSKQKRPMRTRFLTASNFGNAAAPVQNLDFLRLPLPHLPPLPPSSKHHFDYFGDEDLHYLDGGYYLSIENFRIEDALSKFFADSLPHVIDVDIGHFGNDQPSAAHYSSDSEASEVKNHTAFDGKQENRIEFVQFEVTDPDMSVLPLESTDIQMENMPIFPAMSNVEIKMDMPHFECRQQDFIEIERSMYSVDNITPEYTITQQADLLEDGESIQSIIQSQSAGFPLLEVDEASLGIFSGTYTKDESLIFENIEAQNRGQEVELIIDGKELLGYNQFDLLDYLSNHIMQCQKVEVPLLNSFQLMDFMISTEQCNSEEICQARANGDLTWFWSPFLFEEFQFFDLEVSQCLEVFSNIALLSVSETCETEPWEAMNFKSFNELVVCHELTLVDDSFKSLPVPILLEHGQIKLLHCFVKETLKVLEPQCSSTSDGLYLDWHFLEEDQGNCSEYSRCWKLMGEINLCKTDYAFDSVEFGMPIFDLILSGDGSDKPSPKEDQEILQISSFASSTSYISLHHESSSIMQKDEDRERVNGTVPSPNEIKNAHFSDLDFFLNPRECERGTGSKPESLHISVTACPVISSSKSFASCVTTTEKFQQWNTTNARDATEKFQQWNTKLHPVHLSNDILILIDNFHKSFLAILENDTGFMKNQYAYGAEGGLRLLSLSKEKLMDCVQERNALFSHNNDIKELLVALCAIKQMAWYLIYYGVHAANLYVNKLCRSLEIFRLRLGLLQNRVEEAHMMAEKDIHKIHPSLSIVQEILQSYDYKDDSKILIVAESIFWWPLERLLSSLRISYNLPEKFCSSAGQRDEFDGFTDAMMDIVLCSDCCLISHEFISTSFPFNKFGIILEYGGSHGSSRLSNMSPLAEGCFCLHFLKVNLENSNIAKAICDGVQMPKNAKSELKGDSHRLSALNQSSNIFEELLNFIPAEESYKGRYKEVEVGDETCSVMPPTIQQQMSTSEPSYPKTLIIVNTLNFDKEMIISRRSTYQRILALEKEGAQVIERDLKLPIDVIVTAAVCLAWYDCKNIGKKASAPDEAFSCLPLCVENIAASILTSISFSFSCCILVFEGESSYLAGVMESSDELYAAAASLGIDLQVFYSYSSEMTDEIILSCIEVSSKLTRGLYPKMAESVTLAEAFLTAFPSINALSAHAILSSGGILVEFLELSQESRMRVVHMYQVPDESITLFSALSRYGEQENSKSGITDCSSSISSATDSGIFHFTSSSEGKKRKYTENHQNAEILLHDSVSDTHKLFSDSILNLPRALGPYSSNVYCDIDKYLTPDMVFGQNQGSDGELMMKHPKLSQQCDVFMEKVTERSDEIKAPKIHRVDLSFSPEQISEMSLMDKINIYYKKDSGIGEVIDVDSNLFKNDRFVDKSISVSKLVHGVEEDTMPRIFKPPGVGYHRTFPTAAEIDSGANTWFSKGNHGESPRKGVIQHMDTDLKQNLISQVRAKGLVGVNLQQKTLLNSNQPTLHEKNTAFHSETPLRNAIHSAQIQEGSPWTIEFLNRIREKSKQRGQSRLCGISSLQRPFTNASRASKRKSPSILEYYRYQGGNTPKKVIEKRRQSRSIQPSYPSREETPSASFSATWTPVEKKKPRRTLSYATNGRGGQSKLVWRDENACGTNRGF